MTAPAATVLPMATPLLVHEVLLGTALSIGPAVLVVFTGDVDEGSGAVAVTWLSAEAAERDLAAALAAVRAQLPQPADVVPLPVRTPDLPREEPLQ